MSLCLDILSTRGRLMKMNLVSTFLDLVLGLFLLGMPRPIVANTPLVVLRGDPAELICPGNNTNWRHTSTHQGIEKEIYYDGVLQPEFAKAGYGIVDNPTTGEMILSFEHVTINMSGKYECWSGFNTIHESVELIVLETDVVCQTTPVSYERKIKHPGNTPSGDCYESTSCSASHANALNTTSNRLPQNEFIGPNTCGVEPDQILFMCEATYFGNGTPVLELRNLKNKNFVEALCNETVIEVNIGRKMFTCKATVNATKDLDGAQFIWQTKNQAKQKPYNFTTPPLRILYAINGDLSNSRTVKTGDKLNCTADCSQSCGLRWTWSKTPGQGGKKHTECSANWVIKEPGLYRCEATCLVRELRCDVIAMEISPIELNRQVGDDPTTRIVVPALVAVLAAVSLTIIIVFLLHRRRRNHGQALNQSNLNETEMQQGLSVSEPNGSTLYDRNEAQ